MDNLNIFNPLYNEDDDIEIKRLALYQWKVKDFNGWFGKPSYKYSSEELLDFYVLASLRCHGPVDAFGCEIIRHELLKRLH